MKQRWMTLGICLMAGCASNGEPVTPNAPAQAPATAPQEDHTAQDPISDPQTADGPLAKVLPEWFVGDAQAWWEDATVVFVGKYRTESGPCVFHDDGSSDMLLNLLLDVETVYKGQLEHKSIGFNPGATPSRALPWSMEPSRRYLVFLKTEEPLTTALADPAQPPQDHLWPSHFVATVDLSATAQQAEADRKRVDTWIARQNTAWSTQAWNALRTTPSPTADTLDTFRHIIRRELANQNRPQKDWLTHLGPPDAKPKPKTLRWDLNHTDRLNPSPKTVVAFIEVTFYPDGGLQTYREDFHIHDTTWRTLTHQESTTLNLTNHIIDYTRTRRR